MHYNAGACPWCNIEGIRVGKTTAYPGAQALVAANSPARVLWKTYKPDPPEAEEVQPSSDSDAEEKHAPVAKNKFDAHVNSIIAKGINQRTSAEAIASGQRAARLLTKKAIKKEAFKGESVYSSLFPGTTQSIIQYHQQYHTIPHTLSC